MLPYDSIGDNTTIGIYMSLQSCIVFTHGQALWCCTVGLISIYEYALRLFILVESVRNPRSASLCLYTISTPFIRYLCSKVNQLVVYQKLVVCKVPLIIENIVLHKVMNA